MVQVHALGMLGGRLRDRRLGNIDIRVQDLEVPEAPLEFAKANSGMDFCGSSYKWHQVAPDGKRGRRRRQRGSAVPDKELCSCGLEEPLLEDWDATSTPLGALDSVPELELRAWLAPVSHLDAAVALGVERCAISHVSGLLGRFSSSPTHLGPFGGMAPFWGGTVADIELPVCFGHICRWARHR
jgi:hypothetical protein